MTGRFRVFMVMVSGGMALALAGPAFAQGPVQLYPRTAPSAPPPGPEPARPVPVPEPLPPLPAPQSQPYPQSQPTPPPTAPRGIAVTPLPPAAPVPQRVQPAPPPPPPAQSPRDEVLAVVEGFYAALARGDGQQANEFLVPEKRNLGPYEIAAMTRFYSAMSEPLRVLGVGRLDPEVVRVQYAYAHQSGRRCDGVADVTVQRIGGRPLIQRIRALSGC